MADPAIDVAPEELAAPSRTRRLASYGQSINWRAYALAIILLMIWLVFEYLTSGLFLSSRNMGNLLRQSALIGILAAGMTLVIVSGNIDLSAGSAVGLVAIVAGWSQVVHGLPPYLAVLLGLLVGVGMGVWQGFWVAYRNVPSFVVTLGGLLAFRGIGLIITNGVTFSPFEDRFLEFGQGYVGPIASLVIVIVAYLIYAAIAARSRLHADGATALRRKARILAVGPLMLILSIAFGFFAWVFQDYAGMPLPVLFLAVITGVLAFAARKMRFGRHLYAIGGNRQAARLAGMNIARNTFFVFVLMGLLYGIVGVLLASRLGASPPNAGFFMELDAIAAAVIGGTSLAGGIGTVEGALVGALLMQSIANGMGLLNVLTFYQLIVTGLVLIFAVYVDTATKRRRS
jgi:D-xylose transport system permease protein